MSKKVFYGQNDLRFLYYRYKDSSYYSIFVFAITFFVCMILVLNVLLPQIKNYFSIRKEVIAQRIKIKNVRDNINFISSLQRPELNSQLQTTSKALPQYQDFVGILNAISDSALSSGVSIDDFKFTPGEMTVESPGTGSMEDKDLSFMDLAVNIDGDIENIKQFLTEINEKLPLTEVINVDSKKESTIISLRFYHKSYPKISFKEDEPMQPITPEKTALIRKLSSWQNLQLENDITSTGSASIPLFE